MSLSNRLLKHYIPLGFNKEKITKWKRLEISKDRGLLKDIRVQELNLFKAKINEIKKTIKLIWMFLNHLQTKLMEIVKEIKGFNRIEKNNNKIKALDQKREWIYMIILIKCPLRYPMMIKKLVMIMTISINLWMFLK